MAYKNLNLRRAVRQLKWVPVTIDINKLPEIERNYDAKARLESAMNGLCAGKWITSLQSWNINSTSIHSCKVAFEKPSDATIVLLKWS